MNGDWLINILGANANKPFVKRILSPRDYPTMDLGDGRIATHKMEWSESDGKYYVYPTIQLIGGKLKQLQGDGAYKHAMKNKDFIEFDSPEEADWFSKNYKAVWGQ